MEINLTHDQCSNYSGWLHKKSSNLMGGWQKRFFKILDGKMMIYCENENDQKPKGHMLLSDISRAVSTDKKIFKFSLNNRDFLLQTPDEETKSQWIYVINYLREFNWSIRKEPSIKTKESKEDISIEYEGEIGGNIKKKAYQKMKSLDKKSLELLHNHGMIASDDVTLSEKILHDKRINHMITVNNPDIKARFHHGFLYMRNPSRDSFDKKWCFLISSRPLQTQLYETDDMSFEKNKLKEWMKFDCLFSFKYKKPNEQLEPIECLDLSDSHSINVIDKEGKYYIVLDIQDMKHEIYSEIKGDRDKWVEALKNSRWTAKDIKASKSKHPRNIHKLANMIIENNHNQTKLIAELEREKKSIIGDYTQIKDYETLAFIIGSLEKEILSTIDGCIISSPPNIELLRIYTENFHSTYLLIIQHFWSNQYSQLDNSNLIKLSSLLFSYEEKLFFFEINDPNFGKNGRELVKIYTKKTFKNCSDCISNILKIEREIKSIKSPNGYIITNGPNDLFDILVGIYDLIKNYKHYYIHIQILRMFHEYFIQYLIGVDCVISHDAMIIDKEYLLAIANNSINFIEKLNKLIDDWERLNIITKKEIIEAIGFKEIMIAINLMTQNAISRFVSEYAITISESFDVNYLDLDMQKVLLVTHDLFAEYNSLLNVMIYRKVYEEVLKLTAFYYIKLLLTTAYKTVKTVDQLTNKINTDRELLFETYETVVGKNLTQSIMKILSDIHDFLEISLCMISSSCFILREYVGSSFNLNTVKALINLRCDLSKEEKKEAIKECKEVLEKYVEKNIRKRTRGFFEKMEKDIQIENEIDENDLETIKENNYNSNEKRASLEDKTNLNENDKYYYTLDEFLNDKDVDIQLEHYKNKSKDDAMLLSSNEDEEEIISDISDIVYQGLMMKKTYSTWQERFFQLKNGYLYWFKDKKSLKIQNKISIDCILRIESHKNCKFLIVIYDKVNPNKGKIYKFRLESNKEKENWMKVITQEMKNIKGDNNKSSEVYLEIKAKKKVINDYYKLPEIGKERVIFKEKILSLMDNEKYFKPILIQKTMSIIDNANHIKKNIKDILTCNEENCDDNDKQSFDLVSQKDKAKQMGCLKKLWRVIVRLCKRKNGLDKNDAKEYLNH